MAAAFAEELALLLSVDATTLGRLMAEDPDHQQVHTLRRGHGVWSFVGSNFGFYWVRSSAAE